MSRQYPHRVCVDPPCLPGVETIAIASSHSFPRHSHDQFGIGLMTGGAHASWSACGLVEAKQGDVIAVNPNEIHDGAPIGEVRSWEMIFVEPSAVAQLSGSKSADREITFAAGRMPQIASLLSRTLDALRAGESAAGEEALTELLDDLLARRRNPATSIEAYPSPSTLSVIERIRDTPDAPPSLDEVAQLMNLGRAAALRRFRREVGATPQAYAMQLRLRLARRALSSGAPIAEVATANGFADQSHLTRAFARQFGLPPGRWRAATAHANIIQDEERSDA